MCERAFWILENKTNKGKWMHNLFAKHQRRAMRQTVIGGLLMALSGGGMFVLDRAKILDEGSAATGLMALGLIGLATAGLILLGKWPWTVHHSRQSKRRMRNIGLTEEDFEAFSREFEDRREVYKAYSEGTGSVVAVTDNWIYEMDRKWSSLFRIADITQWGRDVEYHTGDGGYESTYVFLKVLFKDGRTVRIRVRVLKGRESISLASADLERLVQQLARA